MNARPTRGFDRRALLATRLELVVPERAARLDERRARFDGVPDPLLGPVDLLGGGQHRLLVGPWNHQHAVGVAAEDVAGADACIADVDDDVGAFDLHAVLTGPHGVAPAEDRVPELPRQMRVAAGAVDHRTG